MKKHVSYLWNKLLLITIEVTNSVEFQEGNFVGVTEVIQNVTKRVKSLCFRAVANH